jgi:hypothetical protein
MNLLSRQVLRFTLMVALLCAMWLSAVVIGQTADWFSLGGVSLRLGMPEAEARRLLEVNHSITARGMLITKGGPPFSVDGAVTFKNGTLSWAAKDWNQGLDQSASVEVVRRLIGILGTRKGCTVETIATEDRRVRRSLLAIRCPGFRQIEVAVGEVPGSGKQVVTVTEYYGPAKYVASPRLRCGDERGPHCPTPALIGAML